MENMTLIKMAHSGDKQARDMLVQENTGLIWSIVRRFLNRGYEAEDLFQIGCIGLIKAIDKFDTGFEVKFSTYAVPLILGEIKRFLRDDGLVKVSRNLKENGWKIKLASDSLAQKYGREARIEEISEYTGLSKEEIVMAMEANSEVESIYKSLYQNDGSEIYIIDKICADENIASYEDRIINKIALEQVISELKDLEKNIIEKRYFQNKTQVQTAKELNISQVQVSRMEKKILCVLKNKL